MLSDQNRSAEPVEPKATEGEPRLTDKRPSTGSGLRLFYG
jgi:hypothetical protein